MPNSRHYLEVVFEDASFRNLYGVYALLAATSRTGTATTSPVTADQSRQRVIGELRMPPPPLGSLAVQAPVPTQTVHVTASTCHNISLFKDLMKEYRKLDDSITMRLNRTIAQYRDIDRASPAGKSTIEDQACLQVWRELVANWNRRTLIINYCVDVLDASYGETKRAADDANGDDVRARRKAQAELYSADIKRTQLHNERTVEGIVRERSANALRARCKYFEPPSNDPEAKRD